ncbi:MAG: hypothetical protein U9O41_08760 [Candidatus Aerophobetes bacterium]|nr:hypothetical protein [Candidatus Aerophobetes bacterium]
MKKYIAAILSVCVFLGVLAYAQPIIAGEVEESKTEALMKYQAKKKEPWIGVGGALLIPSLGHAYAEDWWPRGAKFIGLYLASFTLMANEYTAGIGVLSFWGFRIWELIDAYWAVKDYNKELAERWKIEFSSKRDTVGVVLSYRF